MAIQSNFPTIRPTLDLNFAGSRTVDPRITFTRASTATYFDEFGVMRTAPANTPRIDFDPVTGECKGLLVEEQRTNLLPYSEQFDNATWGKFRTSITANATTAPDGTLTAYKLVEDTQNGQHYVAQSFSVTSGVVYTASRFFKSSERTSAYLSIEGADVGVFTGYRVVFDLVSGTGSVLAGSGSFGIYPVGNGWYRCWISNTAIETGVVRTLSGTAIDRSVSYTGDGTSGIYIWGAQVEAGAFPTSYIPTTTAQVTRAADSAAMTGGNFSSWYRQDEGTLFAEVNIRQTRDGNAFAFSVNNSAGIADNRWTLLFEPTPNVRVQTLRNTNAAGLLVTSTTNSYTVGVNKAALAISQGASVVLNGGTVGKTTTYAAPNVNQLQIGNQANSGYINGHVARLAYYPKRLSDANLQALTA